MLFYNNNGEDMIQEVSVFHVFSKRMNLFCGLNPPFTGHITLFRHFNGSMKMEDGSILKLNYIYIWQFQFDV